MTEPIKIVLAKVSDLTDDEIGTALLEMSDDFPYSGDNYNILILEEAIRRYKILDEASNQ